jgi:hypothetical protein
VSGGPANKPMALAKNCVRTVPGSISETWTPYLATSRRSASL